MADHKFKAGETVTVAPSNRVGYNLPKHGLNAHGKFQVVYTLPPEGGHNQYRIKSNLDGHERVVKEYEIA